MWKCILLLFGSFLGLCFGQKCDWPNDPYEPVAETADFPANPVKLAGWLGFDPLQPDSKPFGFMDVHALRRHAWNVFAGMTAPSKVRWPKEGEILPRWETWYDVDEVFNCPSSREFLTPLFEPPRQLLPLPPGRTLNVTARVLFNRTAREYIRGKRLYEAATLDNMQAALPAATPAPQEPIDFPPAAIAVKTVWMPVKATGCTPIPVWDSEGSMLHAPTNFPDTWPRSVGVVAAEGDETACEHVRQRVPISRFHSVKLDDNVRLEKNLAPKADLGDYLVLVGLHFTTKEIPNWVWCTLWWHDRANQGEFAEDRPKTLHGVWRNYLMDTAYDMDRPMERDATPKIAFNPYLEAGHVDGVTANCMTCHRRATWRLPTTERVTLNSFGQSLSLDQIVVRGSEASTTTYFPEYPSLLKLDFLWSLRRAH
jgi:hypothetical protein